MKKTISLIALLLQTAGFSFAETYVWEDYDDFSGWSLNSQKWGTMYLGGGIQPYLSNGKLVLRGGFGNPNATKVVKGGWENIFEGDDGGSASVYAKDSDIYGIEAEFIIPTNAAQSSGLALGVASLSPLSFAVAELNADPSSTSQYSRGFGFYHMPASGGEVERFKIGQRGVTHRLSVTLTDGVIKMYVDDELQYSGNAGNFNVDMFYVYAFNDHQESGVPFELNADNVRVLRRRETAPSLNVAPLSLLAFRDQVYLQGQNGVSVIAGAGEINFDLELANKPAVSAATLNVDGSTYNLANLEGPSGFRTTFGYRSHDNELFDVESSSASDWSSYLYGKTFSFSLTVDGHDYSYSHDLPAQSALPPIPNLSLSGTYQWKASASGDEYVEIVEDSGLTIDWGSFSSAGANDFIMVAAAEELVGDDVREVLARTYLSSTATSYELPSGLFKAGKNYSFYVAFVKVTQSENPTGFTHKVGTDTSEALLQTTARSVTALNIRPTLFQAETVVSTPAGKPVVVKVGDAYKWNDSLDGVMLWGVWDDEDDGWTAATIQYANGKQKGNMGLYDQLTTNLIVDHPYGVDQSGMIKVTEDAGYQYYQVTGVENGVIQTADDSVFPLSDTSWFFTTKAAAEEYYHSKVGHPNSKGWMWFDQYPWVYSHEEGNWLYFKPSGDKLLYYSVRDKAWREFTPKLPGQESEENKAGDTFTVPDLSLEMLWVEPGTFTMGSPSSEAGRSSNETRHEVTLTQGFWLGKYEVTQAQYEAVMTGNSNGLSTTPSQWPNNPNRSVEKVSWDDAQVFLTRLNATEEAAGRLPDGWSYVLPTESEWEYACRAGTTTAFSWGDDITASNANYSYNIGETRDVGDYAANPWGFHDMHGNVWEWTADWWGGYPTGAGSDPVGPADGSIRVFRGGSWLDAAHDARSAIRAGGVPASSYGNLGFRLSFRPPASK